MATELFLLRQLDAFMAEPNNWDFWYSQKPEPDLAKRLEQLTRHHNGHVRERAVLCLGLMGTVPALPALIERVNDWAMQVRRAARTSILRFIKPENAQSLANCLPNLFRLLDGKRDDHQSLVNQIIHFLALSENRGVLLDILVSQDKNVARAALRVLLEHQIFSEDVLFQRAKQSNDAVVRLVATNALLMRPAMVTTERIARLLKDSYAPIKQAVLHYIVEEKLPVSPSLLLPLLLDRNELVRKRAARLLTAGDVSPIKCYIAAFHDNSRKAEERGTALLGLDEQKYEHVIELALNSLDCSSVAMYKAALLVIVRNLQEDAREYLLKAFTYPSYTIARMVVKTFVKLKLYLTMADIQQSLEAAPTVKHAELCFALARRFNEWNQLILLLSHTNIKANEFTPEAVARWTLQLNRFTAQPSESQKRELLLLIEKHPAITHKDRGCIMQFIGSQ
ncbi:HEAT repeat domain-containing protein [Buttiauxella sp. 3AFRM03]|uniref:HEAT repeat domain-containing protein n=1 Tax=Buttiauxella sp. 3AFRM03 TaxID=2479367 RepID=UPI000EF76302|nr:HEAT repeat domain-containing protein [Buttiauxella sp. 3AFRM03]AYN28124.1 HEAT repeat domain-containing protein [Buttiauxella sp. 3AFRM03]